MELRSIQCFIAVANLGNISRAAETLAIAQPALTRHIKRLEDEFGVLLLSRLPRGVRLTSAGREFLGHCTRIMDEVALTKHELSVQGKQPAGTLTLGASPTLARVLLPSVVEHVRLELPQIRLRVVESLSARLHDALLIGAIDLAVLTNPKSGHGLTLHPLVSEPLSIIGKAGWRSRRQPLTAAELRRTPVFVTPGMRALVNSQHPGKPSLLSIAAEIEAMETIRTLVCNGVGHTIMPPSAFSVEIEQRQCQANRIQSVDVVRTLMLASLPENARSASLREVSRIVRMQVQQTMIDGLHGSAPAVPSP